jgi:hypothetical protein
MNVIGCLPVLGKDGVTNSSVLGSVSIVNYHCTLTRTDLRDVGVENRS